MKTNTPCPKCSKPLYCLTGPEDQYCPACEDAETEAWLAEEKKKNQAPEQVQIDLFEAKP